MAEKFDVVVVGARCAGSPLATLLARQGLRVAVVERAKFPRDTLSSHIFEAAGINLLSRLGVLEKVRETSAEPVGRINFRQDEFAPESRCRRDRAYRRRHVGRRRRAVQGPTPGQGMTDAFRQAVAMAPAIAAAIERSDPELDRAMVEWARWRDRDAFEHHWMASDLGAAGRSPVLLPAMVRQLQRHGQLEPFLDLFQHRALPSQVFTPARLFSTAARLLVRGDGPRADVLSEVGDLIMTDARRKRLRRNPVFVDRAAHGDAGETDPDQKQSAA